MDEPPAIVIPDAPVEQRGTSLDLPAATDIDLPMTQRSDGSLVIDLMPLAPAPQQCAQEEPDPFNPTILVCRKTEPDPRLGADYDPSTDELLFGSEIPRAHLKFSDNAEAQANTIKKSVGGFDADGVEARVKIEF